MKPKRSPASAALELAVVFLVTLLAFAWGSLAAQTERGHNALGGEYILLYRQADNL